MAGEQGTRAAPERRHRPVNGPPRPCAEERTGGFRNLPAAQTSPR
jgi:hypothetical protein